MRGFGFQIPLWLEEPRGHGRIQTVNLLEPVNGSFDELIENVPAT
jgi:hypothetical protein